MPTRVRIRSSDCRRSARLGQWPAACNRAAPRAGLGCTRRTLAPHAADSQADRLPRAGLFPICATPSTLRTTEACAGSSVSAATQDARAEPRKPHGFVRAHVSTSVCVGSRATWVRAKATSESSAAGRLVAFGKGAQSSKVRAVVSARPQQPSVVAIDLRSPELPCRESVHYEFLQPDHHHRCGSYANCRDNIRAIQSVVGEFEEQPVSLMNPVSTHGAGAGNRHAGFDERGEETWLRWRLRAPAYAKAAGNSYSLRLRHGAPLLDSTRLGVLNIPGSPGRDARQRARLIPSDPSS